MVANPGAQKALSGRKHSIRCTLCRTEFQVVLLRAERKNPLSWAEPAACSSDDSSGTVARTKALSTYLFATFAEIK